MSDSMSLGGDVDKLATHYEQWADTYDDDVASHDYGLPATIVRVLLDAATRLGPGAHPVGPDSPDVVVLDAGCGTGLVGVELAAAGYRTIDGVDLSPAMAAKARERGVYRWVGAGVDLTQPPEPGLSDAADVVVVAGVFTVGHVPPSALETIIGLVVAGGLIVTSTRRAYYDETDYQQVSDRLVESGVLELVSRVDDAPYTMDSSGHYFAYRRLQ